MSTHDDYLNPDRHDPALHDDIGRMLAADAMTIRDFFAARAMQGILSSGEKATVFNIASDAYAIADEMLEARKA